MERIAMRELNITRRCTLRGIGALGFASIGSTVVGAQEDDTEAAAVRVAHMSPDAPNVTVRLTPVGDDTTDDEASGNETSPDETTPDGNGSDAGASIEGLGFRDVSAYQVAEPGTYQVEVVAENDGELGDLLADLFGGGEEDETVLLDTEVDLEEGSPYTVVAFGEAARGTASTGAGMTEDVGDSDAGADGALIEDLQFGDSRTVDVESGEYTLAISGSEPAPEDDGMADNDTNASETDVNGAETDGDGADRGLQVRVLEDDISDPGEEMSRLRVFHAVPDAGSVTITATSDAAADGGTAMNDSVGENESMAEDESEAGSGDATAAQSSDVRTAEVSLESQFGYDGFASGYFGSEASATTTPEMPADENATDENATDENVTDDGETAGPAAGSGDAEFELVVVETSEAGERADGGTGGLLG